MAGDGLQRILAGFRLAGIDTVPGEEDGQAVDEAVHERETRHGVCGHVNGHALNERENSPMDT